MKFAESWDFPPNEYHDKLTNAANVYGIAHIVWHMMYQPEHEETLEEVLKKCTEEQYHHLNKHFIPMGVCYGKGETPSYSEKLRQLVHNCLKLDCYDRPPITRLVRDVDALYQEAIKKAREDFDNNNPRVYYQGNEINNMPLGRAGFPNATGLPNSVLNPRFPDFDVVTLQRPERQDRAESEVRSSVNGPADGGNLPLARVEHGTGPPGAASNVGTNRVSRLLVAQDIAKQELQEAFPDGYTTLPYQSGLLGLWSVAADSIERNYPDIARPTMGFLVDTIKTGEFNAAAAPFDDRRQDTYPEHVNILLSMWGRQQDPTVNLQLGYISERHLPRLLPAASDGNRVVVWIQGDSVRERARNAGHVNPDIDDRFAAVVMKQARMSDTQPVRRRPGKRKAIDDGHPQHHRPASRIRGDADQMPRGSPTSPPLPTGSSPTPPLPAPAPQAPLPTREQYLTLTHKQLLGLLNERGLQDKNKKNRPKKDDLVTILMDDDEQDPIAARSRRLPGRKINRAKPKGRKR